MAEIDINNYVDKKAEQISKQDSDNINNYIITKLSDSITEDKSYFDKLIAHAKSKYENDQKQVKVIKNMVKQKEETFNKTTLIGSLFNPTHKKLRRIALDNYNSEYMLLVKVKKVAQDDLSNLNYLKNVAKRNLVNSSDCLNEAKDCTKALLIHQQNKVERK